MDLHLNGLKALVCGASRGLGYATARLLAEEGAQVAINARSPEKIAVVAAQMATATGGAILPVAGDIAEPSAAAAIIEQTVAGLGGLDILITNAGGPPAGPFENFDDATWEKAVEMNFLGHVRLIRAALPHLRQSRAASVLTITSYSVKQPIPNLVLSNSIRAATVGLTKTLALELGNQGIRFNSILPGWTETERVTNLMISRAQSSGTTPEEELKLQARDIALGRLARPQEFASAAVFLVSPAASYITGVMLNVDGGAYKGTF